MTDTNSQDTRAVAKVAEAPTPSMELATKRMSGIVFSNFGQVIEFAREMSTASIGVRAHLRGNVGACIAVITQALEWEMSPFAVANKSYEVNKVIAYEAQLINAVILRRAPIVGRFKIEFKGEGETRQCRVWVRLKDDGEIVDYESPIFSKIFPKNSPLWKSDPDQQIFYYTSRALCRRHFPDVLLGVYAVDEIMDQEIERGPTLARDVTPKTLLGKLDALAGIGSLGMRVATVEEFKANTDKRSVEMGFDPATGEYQNNEMELSGVSVDKSGGGVSIALKEPNAPATEAKAASEAVRTDNGAANEASANGQPAREDSTQGAGTSPQASQDGAGGNEPTKARLADIIRRGDIEAARGRSALANFREDLGDDRSLVPQDVAKRWNETANSVGGKVKP